jgi:hypothetical protein
MSTVSSNFRNTSPWVIKVLKQKLKMIKLNQCKQALLRVPRLSRQQWKRVELASRTPVGSAQVGLA